MQESINAEQFIIRLKSYRSPENKENQPNFKPGKVQNGEIDEELGVRMGQVFALAKEFIEMPLNEIEKLLESPIREARVGAVSIMDFQARRKKTTQEHRQQLFKLYIRRHDRINYWGMVDRAAPYVIGGYLYDKPRDILYELARSKNIWERRTAIVSTYFFIRQGDLEDTFKIAEILVNDEEELIQTAVGGWIREAGKQDPQRLISFLDKYAVSMPRTALRYAIEHLEKEQRDHYSGLRSRV